MNQWKHNSYSKKKVRGLGRRYRAFSKYIDEQLDSLPTPGNIDPYYTGYTSLHLSFSKFFTDSKKIPINARRFFVQKIINGVQHLLNLRTEEQEEYRIFCIFNLSDLEGSSIQILFTKKGMESFYQGFFGTEIEETPFLRLLHTQNLKEKWGINIPKELDVKGYEPIDTEDEYEGQYETWFIGRLN
ncbi:DUF3916 domain-containing protein [Priestia megaterium]|uniref:DUF3916 domain-containing protein n=1 Tax=Priestia megaterium TaxID=1404 RepID=UPI00366B6FAC